LTLPLVLLQKCKNFSALQAENFYYTIYRNIPCGFMQACFSLFVLHTFRKKRIMQNLSQCFAAEIRYVDVPVAGFKEFVYGA
jgi:hypothetical protein